MKPYLDLMRTVLESGAPTSDRTGTGTRSIFGPQMRFDLSDGFPLITTKRVHMKSIIHELLWFLRGESNVRYLQDHGVSIWDEWADGRGELGGDQDEPVLREPHAEEGLVGLRAVLLAQIQIRDQLSGQPGEGVLIGDLAG